MTKPMRLILLLLSLCAILPVFSEKVKLADANASASVDRSASDGYEITVSFRPVTTLDEDANREMTETLAIFYAEEALSSFLNAQKGIVVRGTKFLSEKARGGNEKWTFVVPDGSIADVPEVKVEVREAVVGRKISSRSDPDTVIRDFRSSCFRDLRVAETLFAEKIASVKERAEKDRLLEKIRDAFSGLRKKVKADDDLFRSEKDELIKKADRVEDYLVAKVGGDDDCKRNVKNLDITDAVFREPYGRMLKADPILIAHGGARCIEMSDGSIMILAVGYASADNDDREDIAELRASAELGKLQAGEESVVENKFERDYSYSSDSGKTKENMTKKRRSSTTVNSYDFHKMGETVGTWLSKDGKRFFMAKGRIVTNSKK